jgi:uroporphyrinogen III methyltransferase / synthase
MSPATGPARPLIGRCIAVTRPQAQASALAERLSAAGASVLTVPTISIEPPDSWDPLDRALDRLAAYHWLIFTSANGVTMVRQRLMERAVAAPDAASLRVAAIGPATAAALRDWGLDPDLVPAEYVAEGLATRLRERIRPGERVLLPRAAETRDVLVRALEAMGARVDEVSAYRTRPAEVEADALRGALQERAVDMVTFTSSSTVRHFAGLFAPGELAILMAGVDVACIGPVTAETATGLGLRPHVVADEYTIPGLARAIVRHYEGDAGPAGSSPGADRAGPRPPEPTPSTRS